MKLTLAILLAGVLVLLSLAATSAHTGSAWRALPSGEFRSLVPAQVSPILPSQSTPSANPRLSSPKLAVGPTPTHLATPTTRPCCIVPPTGGIKGQATWFASLGSWLYGAAGPRLRAAIGPGYLGHLVRVCSASRCVSVRLVTSCACQPDTRLVDLSLLAFSRLAAPSRGIVEVSISW